MIVTFIMLLALIVALFVVCGSLKKNWEKKAKETDDSYDRREYTKAANAVKKVRVIGGAVLIVLLCASLFLNSFHIVDSTEIGVVRTLGEISYTIDAGPKFINPLLDKVTMYDLTVHVAQAQFASYSKDAQPLTAAIEYQFTLDPNQVMDIAKEYGSYESLESKIGNLVEERAKIVFAKYSGMSLLENRSSLSSEMEVEVKELEDQFNVKFISVIIKDIDFSDAFEASVEQKMEAEQNALKAEQEKKKAVIKAEEQKEVAEIEAQAAIAKAQGEAEALRITKDALASMPDTYIEQLYLEKWNGVLPTFMSEGSNLMLAPNLG